jgi:hypothetical protein
MHRMHCYMEEKAHFHTLFITCIVKPLTKMVKGLVSRAARLASANAAG